MREPPKKLRPSACGHAKSNHIFDLDSERKDNIKCKMPPDATTTSNMQKMRPDTKQISVKSFMFEVGMGFFRWIWFANDFISFGKCAHGWSWTLITVNPLYLIFVSSPLESPAHSPIYLMIRK